MNADTYMNIFTAKANDTVCLRSKSWEAWEYYALKFKHKVHILY